MYEISRIEAFKKVVQALNRGDEKSADKMMKVIVKSMRSKKNTTQLDIHLKIEDDNEAKLFGLNDVKSWIVLKIR